MKVKDLIKRLKRCDPNDFVVLSSDEEGNSYHVLVDMQEMTYSPSNAEVYLRELTPELEKDGYTKDDIYDGDDAMNAIVLFP